MHHPRLGSTPALEHSQARDSRRIAALAARCSARPRVVCSDTLLAGAEAGVWRWLLSALWAVALQGTSWRMWWVGSKYCLFILQMYDVYG